MRKSVLVVLVLGLFSIPLFAQDFPKAEVFGGYQFLHLGLPSGVPSQNMNGWNASLTGNFNKWFGVTADFSGDYKTISGVDVRTYTYTFGPTVAYRQGPITPFFHALFGGAHFSASALGTSGSDNGFAMYVGGGVDAKVAPHIAVRLGQADWLYYRVSGVNQSNSVRYSAGVVFRF
jgi:opacity protein-like surface antigen